MSDAPPRRINPRLINKRTLENLVAAGAMDGLEPDRARARGGLAAAAAFLQQAAELTPEPAQRASRALEAARAMHATGASERALELLTLASTGPLDALQGARLELLRAQIAFHRARQRGTGDAARRGQDTGTAGRGAVSGDFSGRHRRCAAPRVRRARTRRRS